MVQNVSATVCVYGTVCVSGTERFCYSMCLWYRTFPLQYVLMVQNVSGTVCVSGTACFCYSMC